MAESKRPDHSNNPLRRVGRIVDNGLTGMFAAIGGFVADRPKKVILACTVLAILLASGMARIKVLTNSEDLYTPQGNQAFKDRNYVYSYYSYPQVYVNIFVTQPGKSEGQNVLTKPALLAFLDLFDTLNSTSVQGTLNGVNYTLYDPLICYRPGGNGTNCDLRSVLDYWQYSRTKILADTDIFRTVSNPNATDLLGRPIPQQLVMGSIVKDNATGIITSAAAFQLVMSLQNNKGSISTDKRDKRTDAWQKAAQPVVTNYDKTNGVIHVLISDDWNQEDTASRAITRDVSVIFIGYGLLVAYGVLVLSKPHSVQSRSKLGVANVVSIALAALCTFGLVILCGTGFSLTVQLLALLLLGLGTDDMLVTIAALEETGREMPDASIRERVVATVSRARRGIIVASFTNLVAFATGTSTSLPALSDFMVFASVGVIFVLIFQSTFYVACITLDLKRQRANRMDCLPCRTSNAGPTDGCCGRPYSPTRISISQRIIGVWLPEVILHPIGKIVVIVLAVFLAIGGVIGATKVKENFNNDDFIPSGSYVHKALVLRNKYFQVTGQGAVAFAVYTKNLQQPVYLDYFNYQDELEALAVNLAANNYVNRNPPPDAWYPAYITWLKTSTHSADLYPATGRPQTSAQFYTWLHEYIDGAGSRYKTDIIFSNSSSNIILSSRYTATFAYLSDSVKEVDGMRAVRKVATDSAPDLDTIAYADEFLFYEGYAVIASDTIKSVLIAGAIVFVIVLVMVADLVTSLAVGLMVALVDAELVGFLHWSGLALNSVTSINLLIAIGLAVDYSAFTAFSFMTRTGTRTERAKKALANFGVPVFNGGFTMFLAILPAAAASSFIFQTFFKMFAMIVSLGLFHGLIVLPVLLSYIGSDPFDSAYAREAAEMGSNQASTKMSEVATNGNGHSTNGVHEPPVPPVMQS